MSLRIDFEPHAINAGCVVMSGGADGLAAGFDDTGE
jgi:hypothetical protein